MAQYGSSDGWRGDAACLGTDLVLWSEPGAPSAEAARLCRDCPVRRECVTEDLPARWPAGVRAGLAEDVREPLHAAYVPWRAAIDRRHTALLRQAARTNDRAARGLIRDLAAALVAEADALTGYLVAFVVHADDATYETARLVYLTELAGRLAAEAAAATEATTPAIERTRPALFAAAHQVADLAAPSTPPVPSSLAGAA
ncbi:WhiB family transcriptional regulator [Pseudofrankia sp. DC12]|uniref:WhiB family transcriptional regulator n=1 Tax=Pseudofrankia sp. DC12 TaxID=683315 RepID=UPI0005F81986|nr:WhiB family transcriptional regulator [Pseudofrankia sp. DC12]